MKLATPIAALAIVAMGASPAPARTPPPTPQEPAAPAFERERALLQEARAALSASDYAGARSKAVDAVDALLARPDAERADLWCDLLASVGGLARAAQDSRTSLRAWTSILEVRSRTLPDDHADVLEAQEFTALSRTETGDAVGARPLQEHVLAVREATLAPDHPDLQRVRLNLAVTVKTLGDLRRARVLEEQVLAAYERTLPEEDPRRLGLQQNLGVTLNRLQDLRAARALFEHVLAVRTRILPPDHPELLAVKQNLAATIASLGDDDDRARELFEEVLETNSRILPPDHMDLLSSMNNVALIRKRTGELRGARELLERVLAAQSRQLPDDHPSLQGTRLNLAVTLFELGDLRPARELAEKVLAVDSRTLPDDHPQLQRARATYAAIIEALGDLHGALALEEQVLEIETRTLPDDHPSLQKARENLAGTLDKLGELDRSRELFEQVLEIRLRTLPEDHPDVQTARHNFAQALNGLGDLQGARVLQEQVLAAYSRVLPDDHPDLQRSRHNLATTLRALGDLEGARELLTAAVEVHERLLPPDHPDLQVVRISLAIVLRELGRAAEARALQEHALEVNVRALPPDHPSLLNAQQNLAITLKELGELSGARELEEQVLAAAARTLPDAHPDRQAARVNLAESIAAGAAGARRDVSDRDADAERGRVAALIGEFIATDVRIARELVLTSSSREAEERCSRHLARDLGLALSFTLGIGTLEALTELEPATFALAEITRGAGITAAATRRQAGASPRYAELRAELEAASAAFAGLARDGATSAALEDARRKRDDRERALVELARELAARGPSIAWDVDAAALASALRDGQVVVGFRRFERWRIAPPSTTDSARVFEESSGVSLCAFVVLAAQGARGRPLAIVDLGPLAPIESAIAGWRGALGAAEASRGLSAVAAPAAADLAARGDSLRRLVLDPLFPALGEARHVVLALDDVLHLVPFDALPADAEGRELVGDRLRIEVRATLAELLQPAPTHGGQPELVCVGDVRFDPSSGLAPLPGTRGEIDGLERIFRSTPTAQRRVTLLCDADATKARLVDLAPRARFLHVATHGWFAPDSIPSWGDLGAADARPGFAARLSSREYVRGMSPMLLCGLALAGGSLTPGGSGRAAGLITAEEISTLDLSRCELAVLSACDTNAGERRAGQGVASLQKALQMAGARSVITSLWKVPDVATKELMLDFYRRMWVEKKPKHQALWEAKTKLREAKDERGEPKYTTRDWAAWVLTGDPH